MSNKLAKMAKHKTPTYDFSKGGKVYGKVIPTQNVIEQIKQDVERKVAEQSFACMIAFADMALREEFGFGEYMREEFQNAVVDIYEKFVRGDITMENVVKYMKRNIKTIIWKEEE